MSKKKLLIIIPVLLILLSIVAIFYITNSKKSSPRIEDKKFVEAEDDLDVIPTVTSDVKVSLVSVDPKKEVKLVVDGVPPDTNAIEYELTYSTDDQDAQGAYSTASPDKGKTTFDSKFERKVTLGTCSNNVCRYHVVTSPIKVSIKFEGTYGMRIFQKDYDSANL